MRNLRITILEYRLVGMHSFSMRIVIIAALVACQTNDGTGKTRVNVNAVDFDPGMTPLRRLTAKQYRNTIRDLLGSEIKVDVPLEPDLVVNGLASLGSSIDTISPLGTERYESVSFTIVEQMMANPKLIERHLTCEPAGVNDAGCMREFAGALGKRAWRRPVTDTELDWLTAVGLEGAQALASFHAGAAIAVHAMLQSPHFLFRAELGQNGAFDGWETASRLSYFILDSMPDDELFSAAESGKLSERAEIRAQAERLMAKPVAREGVRSFFADLLQLQGLHALSKDTRVYTAMTPEIGPDA